MTPTVRSPIFSGMHSSATTDGTDSTNSGCSVMSDTSVGVPVRNVRPITPADDGMPS